MNKSELKH